MTSAAGFAAFADPPLASQGVFRAVMEAMARPGTVMAIAQSVAAPAPLGPAAAAVALTLLDHETPVWLDAALAASPEVAQWLRFHTGAPLVSESRRAAFAFFTDPTRAPAFDRFSPGTAEYPDRSATLVLQVESFSGGERYELSGPGISGRTALSAQPLPVDFRDRVAANRELFPCGIDLLLVTASEVAALPRSVRIAPAGG
jgi:alpha-D-ribose 1-methylphosphonate 5-triphosphate synthase subunit PhnH